MIRENKVHQIEAMLQSAARERSGSQSLDGSLLRHFEEGSITLEEALRVANHPGILRRQTWRCRRTAERDPRRRRRRGARLGSWRA